MANSQEVRLMKVSDKNIMNFNAGAVLHFPSNFPNNNSVGVVTLFKSVFDNCNWMEINFNFN